MNDAAERLRLWIYSRLKQSERGLEPTRTVLADLDQALAAERRATIQERDGIIREWVMAQMAAERTINPFDLLGILGPPPETPVQEGEREAEIRRATVERIRAKVNYRWSVGGELTRREVRAILDAEAKR